MSSDLKACLSYKIAISIGLCSKDSIADDETPGVLVKTRRYYGSVLRLTIV